MTKIRSADAAVALIGDNATIAVNSSSGLCCPDAILKALGERFEKTGTPRNLTSVHPIAAGDMFGTKGVDHIARPGLLSRIIGGSYPSGPTNAEPPLIWQLITAEQVAAWNVPSGIVFDMLREGAAKRPGRADQGRHGHLRRSRPGRLRDECCGAGATPGETGGIRRARTGFTSPPIHPDVAIIRATTADENGNLTFEHEGATLGAMEMALAARNRGGVVIAQVKRIAQRGTLKPHDVRVPGILVDIIVEAPDQLQTTATAYDPAISGEIFRPLDTFRTPDFNPAKVIARRVAQELRHGWAVNIGFGISANVPRVLLEEGLHGAVTWVIEQGAVGRHPPARFQVRLRLQRRGLRRLAPPVHLFPGRRLRLLAAVVPRDRQGRLGQRLAPCGHAAPHSRRGRLCRHHGAGTEDRLFRHLQRGREDAASRTASW